MRRFSAKWSPTPAAASAKAFPLWVANQQLSWTAQWVTTDSSTSTNFTRTNMAMGLRYIVMNKHTQRRWQDKFQAVSKPTDYDLDKERLGKQMKLTSMDTIMDPDISVAKRTTFAGLKRAFRKW